MCLKKIWGNIREMYFNNGKRVILARDWEIGLRALLERELLLERI